MTFSKKLLFALTLVSLIALGLVVCRLVPDVRRNIQSQFVPNKVPSESALTVADDFHVPKAEVSNQIIMPLQDPPMDPHIINPSVEYAVSYPPERESESAVKGNNSGETSMPAELQSISTEFRANPGFREISARKIMPYLTTGMSAEEIERLLGQPTNKGYDGSLWRYSVFFSKSIDVYFNAQRRVEKVVPVGVEAD